MMKKKLLSLLLLVVFLPVLAGAGAVQIVTPDQILVGLSYEVKATGLTANSYYVIVYSFTTMPNITFQASGWSYTYRMTVPDAQTTSLTLSIYPATAAGINTSTASFTRTVEIQKADDWYPDDNVLTDMLFWIVPAIVLSAFVFVLMRSMFRGRY